MLGQKHFQKWLGHLLAWPQDGSKRQIWALKVEGPAGAIGAPAGKNKMQPEPSQQSSASDTACVLKSDILLAKCKFGCWTRCETKQPAMWGFGAEKVIMQCCEGDRCFVLKKAPTPGRVQQSPFKGKVNEGHGWLSQTSWCGYPCFLHLLST